MNVIEHRKESLCLVYHATYIFKVFLRTWPQFFYIHTHTKTTLRVGLFIHIFLWYICVSFLYRCVNKMEKWEAPFNKNSLYYDYHHRPLKIHPAFFFASLPTRQKLVRTTYQLWVVTCCRFFRKKYINRKTGSLWQKIWSLGNLFSLTFTSLSSWAKINIFFLSSSLSTCVSYLTALVTNNKLLQKKIWGFHLQEHSRGYPSIKK